MQKINKLLANVIDYCNVQILEKTPDMCLILTIT